MGSLAELQRPGKYPIVLSDALLGKATKEVYTGIRYNHKPDSNAGSAINSLRVRPSESDSASYNLSFSDNAEKYAYQGVRTAGDGQYVLIFEPANQHFVLHRLDSSFDMNLVSAPWSQSAANLQVQYPQLETKTKTLPLAAAKKTLKTGKKTPVTKTEAPKRKPEKPKKAKQPVREPTPEEEDSDDGLTIEYPGGSTSQQNSYNPMPIVQKLSLNEEVSDEDAEHEEYEEEQFHHIEHLKLPSPAHHNVGGISDEDLDLEAELEQELLKEVGGVDESDESEEE